MPLFWPQDLPMVKSAICDWIWGCIYKPGIVQGLLTPKGKYKLLITAVVCYCTIFPCKQQRFLIQDDNAQVHRDRVV